MLQSKKSKKKKSMQQMKFQLSCFWTTTEHKFQKKNEKWKIENYILSIINLESLFF